LSDTRPVISAHYAEIALKGKNRHVFLQRLRNNMDRALRDMGVVSIRHVESRLLVTLAAGADPEAVARRLQRVCGIQWLSIATPVARTIDAEADLQSTARAAVALAGRLGADARHFKIAARRSDRAFPHTSQQINALLGEAVRRATGLPVRLHEPDLVLHVLVMHDAILLFPRKIPGCGGLPVGSSGRVAVLLSGGIDSPVAAWMLMKRGCRPEFVHFFPGRGPGEIDSGKIERLVQILAGYSPRPLTLHLVPAFPYERRAVGGVEDPFDMLLFRRYMVKTAARFAFRENCLALVTGDSVGQVASQTLPNLRAISPDITLPILRPLVGMDKIEITALSRRIGLFETSIEPYRDCCSIRSPRPALNARPEQLLELSERIDLEAAVGEAVRDSVKLRIGVEGRVAAADHG